MPAAVDPTVMRFTFLTSSSVETDSATVQVELKNKDEQYVKALRQGVQDLDNLQDSMARNASRQQMLYEQELLSLESNFEAERKELIEQCRKEWDKLFDKSLQQQ